MTERHTARVAFLTLTVLALAPPAPGQDIDLQDLADQLRVERAARQALAAELSAEREARRGLEARFAELESRIGRPADDDLEGQLQALLADVPQRPEPRSTVFPSAFNPRIGVFMDGTADFGNVHEKLDDDSGDRFSLRETEIDFRLPISAFAEGVLIASYEDAGDGEFESTIEEGYADVGLRGLLDNDSDTQMRVGRFRVPFGAQNQLHLHDLMQVDRPFAASAQLGPEGLIGDGFEFTTPLFASEDEDGLGQATSLRFALTNGEMFTGDEALLGEVAGAGGIHLKSGGPIFSGRASHFVELSSLSDVEFGASALRFLTDDSVEVTGGGEIQPEFLGVDATFRTRDDESGVGGWVVTGEVIQTDVDYGASSGVFPDGDETTRGWYLTAQRQLDASTYVGLRLGRSDVLTTDGDITDITPYVTWYADEFFRIRLQGQHLKTTGFEDGDNASATRGLLQFSWNFGAHQPHPYWVNR